jgi:hypothetical protein
MSAEDEKIDRGSSPLCGFGGCSDFFTHTLGIAVQSFFQRYPKIPHAQYLQQHIWKSAEDIIVF